MHRAALALVIALAVPGPSTREPAFVLQPSTGAPVTITFELVTRHVIVHAKVNNSRPLWFVLDTGANAAIVTMATATELGLTLEGNVQGRGAGPGTQAGRRVKNATWSLVGLEKISQPVSLALPMTLLPSGLGHDVDGIIGGEFIKQFVLALDYQARTITFHDRKTFRYNGNGQTLPLDFTADGHPVLKAAVTPLGGAPIEHRFMLDIGSGLALALHSPFVAEHNLLREQSGTIRAIGMAGAGGVSVGRLGRVGTVQIGTFTIANPITLLSEDKAGAFANASLAGNIGAQIASRFRMIFDYGRRSIILEPSATFADPFDRAMSGIALRGEGSDHRTFRVKEVLENSPATEAGLAEGDVITSIDGVAASTLTLTAILEMLDKAVARELTLQRGEQVLKVTLTPRRLI
ncbi:MAG TPA: aspartyl protease family protein [Vicinamibacterales bacterium]|jgi:hypothetical protein|nr:aspartyl protease family protein [Vicinamibacterales bacterium]